mmetsp:Transcript_31677/g.82675  ORF Transcript_31677/g.82675 Transcript_31677/m.82675 type:complete len:188 (-) Transcript_31677:114-677(-)|eukprot:CAMPEP_0113886842 /NCGR_PEP_ID=MMETSP0780_2-20120614/11808_1 /TAXON_ID=652834 /ORGANISM="Palpitomonas bilix" /LENGTH=187 /DNA_ID=CAMNT_0000875159 /DNA_START=14 /DNA_END=577 /DNA_ORIENTATION=+ /assembly_acc=CAM_ASM_000599
MVHVQDGDGSYHFLSPIFKFPPKKYAPKAGEVMADVGNTRHWVDLHMPVGLKRLEKQVIPRVAASELKKEEFDEVTPPTRHVHPRELAEKVMYQLVYDEPVILKKSSDLSAFADDLSSFPDHVRHSRKRQLQEALFEPKETDRTQWRNIKYRKLYQMIDPRSLRSQSPARQQEETGDRDDGEDEIGW